MDSYTIDAQSIYRSNHPISFLDERMVSPIWLIKTIITLLNYSYNTHNIIARFEGVLKGEEERHYFLLPSCSKRNRTFTTAEARVCMTLNLTLHYTVSLPFQHYTCIYVRLYLINSQNCTNNARSRRKMQSRKSN